MVKRFIQWFEAKTQVYLHPRFVIIFGMLFFSLLLFGMAYLVSALYIRSIRSTGPMTEVEQAEYDAKMRVKPIVLPPKKESRERIVSP